MQFPLCIPKFIHSSSSNFHTKNFCFILWIPKFSLSKSILIYLGCLCVSTLKLIYCIHVYFSLIDCKLLHVRIYVWPSLLSFKAPINNKQSNHIWEMNQWINEWLTLIVVVEKMHKLLSMSSFKQMYFTTSSEQQNCQC